MYLNSKNRGSATTTIFFNISTPDMQRGNKVNYCDVLLQLPGVSYLSDEKVPMDQGHEAKVGIFEHVVH